MLRLRRHQARGHADHRGGYTLVEMIMVMLVAGIAAGLVVPMLGNSNSTKLKAAANLLAADLAYAQTESITHSDDLCLVIFDTTNHTYRIAKTSTPDASITNPVGGGDYEVVFGEGRAHHLGDVTISTLSMNGDSGTTADRFQYGIYGQIDQAADATVTLACKGKSIVVTIHASTGEATIGSLK